MRALLFIFGFFFLAISCQNKQAATASLSDASDEEGEAGVVDTTSKATAIFWVDKINQGQVDCSLIRRAKAKVSIDSIGKVMLHSFTKEQAGNVQRYLRYRLTIFRVSKQMLDSGYVKPGEQYVQLRYIPCLADRF